MGAWIETAITKPFVFGIMSLPSWERGLKLPTGLLYAGMRWSLPSWERGLKHVQIP